MYDIVIENGLFFDGLGSKGVVRHLGIRDGRLICISAEPILDNCIERIDADGCWLSRTRGAAR